MSSSILKSFNVIAKTGQKVVGAPQYRPSAEESAESFAKVQEVDQIKLEQELERMKEQAQKELDEWRQKQEQSFLMQLEEEKRRGYEEAYQLGFQDGKQHAEQLCQSSIQKAAEVLELAYQKKAELIQEAEPFVIELTTAIAKKVLQQELKTHPDALVHIIKQTLSSVYETSSISIGVAPEDFAFVQKHRQQLLAADNGQVEIKVVPDYSIENGGCVIRTSSGSIDARIDVQLSEIRKALLSLKQEELTS